MARAYWLPRKTSSCSFSILASVVHCGIRAPSRIAITLMPTSKAANA